MLAKHLTMQRKYQLFLQSKEQASLIKEKHFWFWYLKRLHYWVIYLKVKLSIVFSLLPLSNQTKSMFNHSVVRGLPALQIDLQSYTKDRFLLLNTLYSLDNAMAATSLSQLKVKKPFHCLPHLFYFSVLELGMTLLFLLIFHFPGRVLFSLSPLVSPPVAQLQLKEEETEQDKRVKIGRKKGMKKKTPLK